MVVAIINRLINIDMSNTLIEKTLPSLTAFFAIARPTFWSTPYALKRDDGYIPFWGYSISKNYPDEGNFIVKAKTADGQQEVNIRVLPTDELYYTTETYALTGVAKTSRDVIYTYDDMTIETLSSFADPNSEINKNSSKSPSPLTRYNKSTTYKNTDEDKNLIKFHLQKRINYVDELDNTPIGTKNLIYFSIFADPSYISMLEICLKSINKFTINKNFDILFITDYPTQTLISALPILSEFNINYLILDNVSDPVEASVQKMRIFEYQNLNEYQKILYLDVDIIAIGDLNLIFNSSINTNTLEAVMVKGGSPVSANHSLRFFDQAELLYILQNQIRPFNAGHFMFLNTAKMIEHFKNVFWLYSVWPGAYFYEQSFMNYYFNIVIKNVSYNVLNDYITIGSYLPIKQNLQDTSKLAVHFIGGGPDKLSGIKNYITLNNIEI